MSAYSQDPSEEWTCPRCGLVGDHHKTPDAERCDECCATDAALEMLGALRGMVEPFSQWEGEEERERDDASKSRNVCVRAYAAVLAAIAKAEGRTT